MSVGEYTCNSQTTSEGTLVACLRSLFVCHRLRMRVLTTTCISYEL